MYPMPGGAYSPQPEYAPAGHPGATPGPQIHPDYGYQAQGYAPPEPNAYSPPPGVNPYAAGGAGGPRRADENVSSETSRNAPSEPVSNNPPPSYNSEGIPFYDPPNVHRDGGSHLAQHLCQAIVPWCFLSACSFADLLFHRSKHSSRELSLQIHPSTALCLSTTPS